MLSLGSASSCIGVSQTRSAGSAPGAASEGKTCRLGTRPAIDGLLDDFEDENTQLSQVAGRDGYWWTKHDEKGSTVGPDPFMPSEGGADASGLALRAIGKTAIGGPETWGAGFGANLLTRQNAVYDASKYVGISFKAKVGQGSTRQVRFSIGDANTHPNAGICKVCWNHFGKDLTVTNHWKEYRVLFSELGQQASWGDPRPAALTPSKLVAIDWSITGGQVYDLWIDDIQFLDCK
jgi:hypothetical protein